MKMLSIWRAPALLAVWGFKKVETRTWPAPPTMIGQHLGIASTKQVKRDEREWCSTDEFLQHYATACQTVLDAQRGRNPRIFAIRDWDDLPGGQVFGVALLTGCELMTEQMIAETDPSERAFGNWKPGNYAWHLADPVCIESPMPVQGRQGIWSWP